MLIIQIILIALFCLRNSKKASLNGLNATKWVAITIGAYIAGIFAAAFLLSVIVLIKNPAMVQQTTDQAEVMKTLMKDEGTFALYTALLYAGGVGGYLLTRFLLDRQIRKNAVKK